MAMVAAISIAILLSSHAMADIMLQPGYGQKQPATETPLQRSQSPVQQTRESVARPELQPVDPGYHLELHPVYSGPYQIPVIAVAPWLHPQYMLPPLSKLDQRRLAAGSQDLSEAAQNRYRRSTGRSESPVPNERGKRNKDDVATKSSLGVDEMSVVNLPSQDEDKRANARRSSETLLGLNPSSMYQRYIATEMEPAHDTNQETAARQKLSQINSRAAEPESKAIDQGQPMTVQISIPRMNTENAPQTMLLQHGAPQLQQLGMPEYRNAPDPRPGPIVKLSLDQESRAQQEAPSEEVRTVQRHSGAKDKELVGTKHDTIKVKQHVHTTVTGHSNGNLITYGAAGTSFPAIQPGGQQVIQVYQSPSIHGANGAAGIQYILVPQTYTESFIGNYAARNQDRSLAPNVHGPITICMQIPDNASPVIYQAI